MLTTKKEITHWLNEMKISSYEINKDLSVDVNGNVILSSKNLTIIPIQFNIVHGNFYCDDNKLTTLLGMPRQVGGCVALYGNLLNNYQYVSKSIAGDFYCSGKIDLVDLALMKLQGQFVHYYQNNDDKIDVFSHLYQSHDQDYWVAYIGPNTLKRTIRMMTEKKKLESTMTQELKPPCYKIKV